MKFRGSTALEKQHCYDVAVGLCCMHYALVGCPAKRHKYQQSQMDHAIRCLTSIVLYTEADSQCDKQASAVS